MIQNSDELARTERHEAVLDSLEAGVDAAHPQTVIETAITLDGSVLNIDGDDYDLAAYDDLYVVGGGNAGGQVATALEAVLGDVITDGVVVTDDPAETERITVVEGTHPLPSEANVSGTQRLLTVANQATADDLVLVVISGGGSALMCAPTPEMSLEDYRDLTDQLLRSGATIDEINAVRKHLSTFKGGQLARTIAPATTVGLIFSDVVGNRLDVIASGPTAPDTTTYDDCRAVIEEYGIEIPAGVEGVIQDGVAGQRQETPGDGDAVFDTVTNHILADGRTALDAAADSLDAAGYDAVVLSTQIEGEASDVGTVHTAIGAECLESGSPFTPPVALLSGGETTVTVEGDGHGGPNQEFALGAALNIDSRALLVAGIDTDGIDGNSDVAGAVVDGTTVSADDTARARTALRSNDAYSYLGTQDCLIETGATGTNVNDLRIVLVEEL